MQTLDLVRDGQMPGQKPIICEVNSWSNLQGLTTPVTSYTFLMKKKTKQTKTRFWCWFHYLIFKSQHFYKPEKGFSLHLTKTFAHGDLSLFAIISGHTKVWANFSYIEPFSIYDAWEYRVLAIARPAYNLMQVLCRQKGKNERIYTIVSVTSKIREDMIFLPYTLFAVFR